MRPEVEGQWEPQINKQGIRTETTRVVNEYGVESSYTWYPDYGLTDEISRFREGTTRFSSLIKTVRHTFDATGKPQVVTRTLIDMRDGRILTIEAPLTQASRGILQKIRGETGIIEGAPVCKVEISSENLVRDTDYRVSGTYDEKGTMTAASIMIKPDRKPYEPTSDVGLNLDMTLVALESESELDPIVSTAELVSIYRNRGLAFLKGDEGENEYTDDDVEDLDDGAKQRVVDYITGYLQRYAPHDLSEEELLDMVELLRGPTVVRIEDELADSVETRLLDDLHMDEATRAVVDEYLVKYRELIDKVAYFSFEVDLTQGRPRVFVNTDPYNMQTTPENMLELRAFFDLDLGEGVLTGPRYVFDEYQLVFNPGDSYTTFWVDVAQSENWLPKKQKTGIRGTIANKLFPYLKQDMTADNPKSWEQALHFAAPFHQVV